MIAILKRELSAYFSSAVGYIVMAVFFFFSGIFFSICLLINSADLGVVFSNMFVIVLFIIPIITMKTFSEEKRQKTDQALLTAPINLFEIVMGKFLGALTVFACCLGIYIFYALIICFFTKPDWVIILSTLFGTLLFGAALIAIDIFVSALTESQAVAAIFGIAVGMFIYLMDSVNELTSIPWIVNIVNAISFNKNYINFTYGIFSLSNIVFFISVIAIFIFLTIRVLEKKRWS